MKCRKCDSKDLQFFRSRHRDGTEHIIACCNSCYCRSNIPKSPAAIVKVQLLPWLEGDALKANQKEWKRLRKIKSKNQGTLF